jgi:hypothetical protein
MLKTIIPYSYTNCDPRILIVALLKLMCKPSALLRSITSYSSKSTVIAYSPFNITHTHTHCDAAQHNSDETKLTLDRICVV